MAGRTYTYTFLAKDLISGKLSKLAAVGGSTYGKLQSAQQRYNQKVRESQAQVSGLSSRIKSMAGSYLSVAGVIFGAKDSLSKWDAQVQAEAQVMQGLISTNQGAGRSFEQLTSMASKLQEKTIFGDESILQGVTAQILTFTSITGDAFDRTQKAVLDVTSRLYGAKASEDQLRSTSIMLGKALNDPVANLGQLSRSGIQFTKDQKAVIKQLWQTGQSAKAQSMILKELEKQYGGSAEAAAKVGLGGWKQFTNRIGDLQEKLGPMLNKVLNGLMQIFGWVERNINIIGPLVTILGSAILAYKGVIVVTKVWAFVQSILNKQLLLNPIGLIIAGIAALVAAIVIVKKKTSGWAEQWTNFKDVVQNIWDRIIARFQLFGGKLGLIWEKVKKTLGFGSKEDVAIQQASVTALENKLNGLKKNAPSLEWKLKWNKKGEESPEAKKKGFFAGLPSGANSGSNADDLAASVSAGANNITSGGSRTANITVSVEKLVENINLHTSNVTEGISEIKDMVQEELLRVLNSANKLAFE